MQFHGERELMEKLGQLETFVLDNGQQALGIPAHWKTNPNEPLKFDVIINEKSQLILEGPVVKPSKIHNSRPKGADESDNVT